MGTEYFLKRRSPVSTTNRFFSFFLNSFIHVPRLARPPNRVVGPQTGQGSISAPILFVYIRARFLGAFWPRDGRLLVTKNNPRRRTIVKNLLLVNFIVIIFPLSCLNNT
jgi:hypothetical protein